MNWFYKGKEIKSHADLHKDCTDFVYELQFVSGRKYIGKKTCRSESILPAQKKGLREGAERVYRHILRNEDGKIITSKADKRKARKTGLKAKREEFDKIVTDKPFTKYVGSSEENSNEVLISKEILYQSSLKKTATYVETALLFANDVLFNDTYTNICIAGTFWDDSLQGILND